MGSIKWIIRLHLNHPFQTFFVFSFAIVEVLLFLYPVTITANIIDLIINGAKFTQIQTQLFILFGIALIQVTIFFCISFLNEILAHRVTTDMTRELFESLQNKSLTYHDQKDIGQIMARATGDTRTINIALSPGIRLLIAILTVWGLSFYLTIKINWLLGLFTIFILFIFLLTSYFWGKSMIPLSTKTLSDFSDLSETTSISLFGIREIKSYTAENWSEALFIRETLKHTNSRIKEGRKGSWFYPVLIVTFYSAATIVIALFYGFNGLISFRDIVLIAGIITFLRGISSELDWVAWFLIGAIAANKRVYNLINEIDEGKLEDGNIEYSGRPASIEFKNVNFRYNESLPYAIKNVSFKLKENQTLAIVGSPGSGKSTITKLIQRLYVPTSGEILIGNYSITGYSNQSLRKQISTVEQDIFLFNDTIFENIRFGKPDSTLDNVIKVAKLAEADGFINEFEKKYDNIIGEGGIKLSGGQAQRISIARALLMNPSILLMDDGASALDAKTESKIQKAISEILKTRTTIITTHRLAIIAKADIVLIINKGEVVGIGPHEELIKTNHYYRRLFESHYELPPIIASD